ncbi:LuxR C-terminal-related transcriptional regulator [Plebeiibacterium sediminum]|uniref:LuxR C-terminal-related transcriptional regulator n=1 Tax=Plebeiibacterium sediminum TaxID=2992112 RepID=A0AAE3SGF5_9BACT|nr:LuxR C-terminal-related transcriptional regulator [Plebeiobacterium sediminum]MCW3788445.1 LuxR C-terminal-related transcriptional regulator [Plebeiobacterium sediminum]
MSEYEFSFNDLVHLVEKLSGTTDGNHLLNKPQADYKELQNLICLDNQFYHIIQFPQFKLFFTSHNISNILGYHPEELTLKRLYSYIHPEDYPVVLLATKKMCEFVITDIDNLKPFRSITSMDFRIRHKDGHYIRLLNQNCLFKKGEEKHSFQTLSFNTDISHIKESLKIEFNYTNNGDNTCFCFPDEELTELSSVFTKREKEILALLAMGKSSNEIGTMLNISKHTVDTHRRKMLSKSHLCNTAELIAYSISNHLIKE